MERMDRLKSTLSDRYRLLEEIGEGGMSTGYLADDIKHERKVAFKVLKPELAAVVGADGFLFFVMPYIDGETLADKLEREKQLPVDEAVGIATAVASALSVAHEQWVIHRDIKPGNVLLSRGEPLVSDFGIAIAVTRSGGSGSTKVMLNATTRAGGR